jgi:hypothetical protein
MTSRIIWALGLFVRPFTSLVDPGDIYPPHPSHIKSHRSGDKKKKMKKVVYYETDSSSPSTSGSDVAPVTSKRHERKKYSKMPLRYPRVSKRTPLFSIPLGKPPVLMVKIIVCGVLK